MTLVFLVSLLFATSSSMNLNYILSGIYIPESRGVNIDFAKEKSIYNHKRSSITPCLRSSHDMRPQEHQSWSSGAR